MQLRRRIAVLAALAALFAMPPAVRATPFADVPANHWAYQAIQSLAADGLIDGYPDGSFNGDRPLTRYEMAAIVARVIAKIEATGATTASRSDLDKLQKLIDALKDELDALGVRVTNLEDAVSSLDRKTRFAQSIAVHGTILGNGSFRDVPVSPHTIAGGGIDQFVNVYATSPDNNNPLDAQFGPQTILRFDDRFNFIYTVNENVTVSIPLHVIDYGAGSTTADSQRLTISPDAVIDIGQAGAFTNLTLRDAELDNQLSSRLGLTYRAPDAAQQNDYQNPTQPYPRGFEIGGILSGLTTFQVTFSRVDQTLLNTQSFLAAGNGDGFGNNYFSYVVPPQSGLVQTGAPGQAGPGGSLTTDAFSAGANGLRGVFLSKKAVAGTVYIASYSTPSGSATFNSAGQVTSGAGIAAPPPFSYLDGTNEVVFGIPLPPGSRVTIAYTGLGFTNNDIPQRYQAGVRINQKFAGVPGAEVGLTFHRLWDEDVPTADTAAGANLGVNGEPAGGTGFGNVADMVFGLDFQVPLPLGRAGSTRPVLFGEFAGSRYTPDQSLIAPVDAGAAVAGLKLALGVAHVTLQYQSVGANYLDGAPLRFFGAAPPTWANYQGATFPQFFGFANTLGINQTFDASIDRTGAHSATASNAALTFLYPVFNPFVAGGPEYYSAFAPNTQGPSLTFLTPMRIVGLTVDGRIFAQHLAQVQPDAGGTATFGPQFATLTRATFDKLDAGASIPFPFAGRSGSINLSGTLEHLKRNDTTGQAYIPFNPSVASYDPGAVAAFQTAGGTVNAATGKITSTGASAVVYYPNYVNMYHTSLGAGASLPVTPDLTFNTQYSDQRYFGSYGTTLQQNIGGTKDQVDLGLTYTVPKTSSSVGVNFRNATYHDATLPSFNLNENREDVNFTIRF